MPTRRCRPIRRSNGISRACLTACRAGARWPSIPATGCFEGTATRTLDGVVIGRVGLWNPEGWFGVEVGWKLARHAWGQGYATEAATAAITWGFDDLGVDRLISVINPENSASLSVAAARHDEVPRRRPRGASRDHHMRMTMSAAPERRNIHSVTPFTTRRSRDGFTGDGSRRGLVLWGTIRSTRPGLVGASCVVFVAVRRAGSTGSGVRSSGVGATLPSPSAFLRHIACPTMRLPRNLRMGFCWMRSANSGRSVVVA